MKCASYLPTYLPTYVLEEATSVFPLLLIVVCEFGVRKGPVLEPTSEP